MVLPRLKSICVLPPQPMATYYLPLTSYDTGIALAPAPQLNSQSFSPVLACSARMKPLPSP